MRYTQNKNEKILSTTLQNLDQQMERANPKNNSIYGWWTWIDAIQMAMPVYMQVYKITGEEKYRDHAMQMYRWSRNECGGGLFNEKDGLWWRDADYVPPYKEPDGKDCYWSRGNGWVYAALVRCMNQLDKKDKAYKELKKDFLMMSEGLRKCQREDGFWNPSLGVYKLCHDGNKWYCAFPLWHGMGHSQRTTKSERLSRSLRPSLGCHGEDQRS